jgi:hypothetical protein
VDDEDEDDDYGVGEEEEQENLSEESNTLNDTCTAQVSSLSALIHVSDIFDDDITDNYQKVQEINISMNTTHLGANNSTMESNNLSIL